MEYIHGMSYSLMDRFGTSQMEGCPKSVKDADVGLFNRLKEPLGFGRGF